MADVTHKFVSTLHALATSARTKRKEHGQQTDPLLNHILSINDQSINWFCSIDALHSFIIQTSKLTSRSVVLPSDIAQYEQFKQQGRLLSSDELLQSSTSSSNLSHHQTINETELRDQINKLSTRSQNIESRLAQAQQLRDQLKQQVESNRLQRQEQRAEIDRIKRRIAVAEHDSQNQTTRMNESIQAAITAASSISRKALSIDRSIVCEARLALYRSIEKDIEDDVASFDEEANQISQKNSQISSVQSMLDIAYRAQIKSRLQLADQQARCNLLLSMQSSQQSVVIDSASVADLRVRSVSLKRQLDTLKSSNAFKESIQAIIQSHLSPIILRDQQAKIDRCVRRAARWDQYSKLAIQQHEIACCLTAALQHRWIDQLRRKSVIDQLAKFLKDKSSILDPFCRLASHAETVHKEAARVIAQLTHLSDVILELNGDKNALSEPVTHISVEHMWTKYSSQILLQRQSAEETLRWAMLFHASLATQTCALDRSASQFSTDVSRPLVHEALVLVDELGGKLNHLLELDAHRSAENRTSIMSPSQLVYDFFFNPQRILTVHRALQARLLAIN